MHSKRYTIVHIKICTIVYIKRCTIAYIKDTHSCISKDTHACVSKYTHSCVSEDAQSCIVMLTFFYILARGHVDNSVFIVFISPTRFLSQSGESYNGIAYFIYPFPSLSSFPLLCRFYIIFIIPRHLAPDSIAKAMEYKDLGNLANKMYDFHTRGPWRGNFIIIFSIDPLSLGKVES